MASPSDARLWVAEWVIVCRTGPTLQGDQVIELVTAVGSGGQAEPAASRDLLDGILEGRRRRRGSLISYRQCIN